MIVKFIRVLLCSLRIAEEGTGGHGPLIDHGGWFECGNCGMRRRYISRSPR